MQPGPDLFTEYQSLEFSVWRQRMRRRLREDGAQERLVLVCWRQAAPVFPPICPNCMAPTAGQLKLERVHNLRHEDSEGDISEQRTVEELSFPVCAACLQRHRAEQRPVGSGALLRRLLGISRSGGLGLGGLAVFAVGLLFLQHGLVNFDKVALAIGCVPLMLGAFLMRISWKVNRHITIPNETSVSLSVELSPVLSVEEEPIWRAFRFRLPSYAGLFRQANEGQLWDPQGTEAQAARAKRKEKAGRYNWLFIAIGVVVILFGIWSEYIEPFLGR
jgi:hypothetical protein